MEKQKFSKKEVYFGQAISKDNILEINKELGDDDLNWCIASASIPDYEQDIVDVATLDLSRHTSERPIPILCSHLKKMPDGTFPVIGEIVKFVKNKNKDNIDVLYVGWKWIEDKNPELVGKVKPLYPRHVNNFSISFIPDTSNATREKNGLRWKNQIMTELSLTLIGMNPMAVALKEISKSLCNDIDHKTNELIIKSLKEENDMSENVKKDMNCGVDTESNTAE